MDKFTQMKNLIRSQFEGVLDDDFADTESMVCVMLQDRFDVSEWVANEFLKAFFAGKL